MPQLSHLWAASRKGLLTFLLSPIIAIAGPVAEIADTKGAVSVIRGGNQQIVVSSQSTLEVGDIVVTETNSTAVVAFTDGGKVALRPNTRFRVARYHFKTDAPDKDDGAFGLLKGGLRTVTGMIGKRGNQDAYEMKAATATIGIRGTDYTARLCQGDCGTTKQTKQAEPVARISTLKGQVMVTAADGATRPLAMGASLAIGDRVETGESSWAGITFSDNSRVVIRPRSAFLIKGYRHDGEQPKDGNFATELLKGGFRAMTGTIGKQAPERVQFDAVTGTIGIRGTDFDVWCVPTGSYQPDQARPPETTTSCDEGLLTAVREGGVALTNTAGTAEVAVGESAYADSPITAPSLLAPPVMLPTDDGSPAPASLPLFEALPPLENAGDGVHVQVHEGRIVLTQGERSIELGAGESGFASADGMTLQRTDEAPNFLNDPYLRKVDFDAVSCTLP